MQLDHVLMAVADLAAAARELDDRYGLASLEGGAHPGWGTANRIVPLGASYLELIAVVDEAEAAANPLGRWLAQAVPGRLVGWAVRTHELDVEAQRLGLMVSAGSRITPDGTELRWRSAGIEESMAEPFLPFLIEWDPRTRHPGLAGPTSFEITTLVLNGDPKRLSAWLGEHELPLVVHAGDPGIASVVLAGPAGDVTL